MKQAMAWLEKARALEQKYLAAKAQPQNLPGVLQEMLAFVASYNEKWPQEAIEDAATPGQVVSAFYRLKEMNDPFEASRAYQQAEEERVFRMLEALGKAAPESLERLVEKHSNPSPTTSVTSEKSSV